MGAGLSTENREDSLPPEIQDNVLSYLTRPDLQRLSSTSKSLQPHLNPRTINRADNNHAAMTMAILKGGEDGKRFMRLVEKMPDAEKLQFLQSMLELTNMQNIFSQRMFLLRRLKSTIWIIANSLRNAESMLRFIRVAKAKAPRFYNDPDFMKELGIYVDVREQIGFSSSDLPSEELLNELAQQDIYLDLDDDYQGPILVYIVQWVRDDKGMPPAQEYLFHDPDDEEEDHEPSGPINLEDYYDTSEVHFPRETYPEQRKEKYQGTLRHGGGYRRRTRSRSRQGSESKPVAFPVS